MEFGPKMTVVKRATLPRPLPVHFETPGARKPMARIRFTRNIQRHVECPEDTIEGDSIRVVLDGYFAGRSHARSYVLDEQGALRKHMAIFVNGSQIKDRGELSDALGADDVIDVMQALSGG